MTKAVIPIMKKHNISAITVGVNPMTSPPAVPPHPFVWKLSPQDNDEDGIIAFWHPGANFIIFLRYSFMQVLCVCVFVRLVEMGFCLFFHY